MDKSLKSDQLNKCKVCRFSQEWDSWYSCKYGNDLFGDDEAENKCADRFVHPQEPVKAEPYYND